MNPIASPPNAPFLDGMRNQAPPPLGWPGRLSRGFRKYQKIFRASLIERMTYRGDFFFGTILRFFPMVTTILLWQAIYLGAGKNLASSADQISDFSFKEMIAYLLLVHVSRMFSSMPGLAYGIARDIREGTLKKYLLQPIEMIPYLLTYRLAHKTAYITTSFLPYALLFFLCRGYFTGWPDPWTLAAYAASLLMGFLVGFCFESAMGMIGFWFLEVTSFLYVINTVNFFVSGHMFPLDMLAEPWASALKLLPFQYMAYFPAAVFLGKIQGQDLIFGLMGEALWVLVFLGLSLALYRLGLRRYSAYGG